MKTRWLRQGGRWAMRLLAVLGLALILTAGWLWWWAGQEGSLEWTLRRVTRGQPLQSEGIEGSLRSGWRIKRLAWEQDGLRLEVEDVTLDWQPLALLGRTVRLDTVQVGVARVIDQRPASNEPFRLPESLRLPWRVTVDEVAVARIEYRGRTSLDASGLAGRYAFDGLRHRVHLKSLRFAGGDYRGQATLVAMAPHALEAKLAGRFQPQLPQSKAKVPLEFEAVIDGSAAEFGVEAELRVREAPAGVTDLPSAKAKAQVKPFEPMPLVDATADFQHLDLEQLWPTAPQTQLSGHIAVVPAGTTTWKIEGDVRNALPGAWDKGRLPVRHAIGAGQWRDGVALVQSLRAEVGRGSVEGSGEWEGAKGWRFKGTVRDLDPAQLHGKLGAAPVSGRLDLRGEGKAVAFDVDLRSSANARGVPAALQLRELIAQGRWAGDTVSLPQLRVRTSDASLTGKLELQLAAASGSGELKLAAPGLQGEATGSLAETRGGGVLKLRAPDLARAQQWLRGLPGLEAAPATSAQGEADLRLAWQGGWRNTGTRLDLAGNLRHGQRKFALTAAGQAGHASSAAASVWRGHLAALTLAAQEPAITDGAWQLQLRRGLDWRWAGGNFELAGGEAVLRAPALRSGTPAAEAMLAWAPVRKQGGQLSTSGRLSGLPMAWIELVGGPQLAGSALSGDMVFDAQWDAQLGSALRVDASLARVRGDVTVLTETLDGSSARVAAGVRDARITVSNQGEQLTVNLLWDSERAGRAGGQLRTRLARTASGGWQWPEQAPLAGNVQAQLPRIGVWSLLAPPGWRLRGSLSAKVAIAGTRAAPEFSGPVEADDLALRSVVDGIELRDGRLRAQLVGQRLVVSQFLLRGGGDDSGGGGTLAAFGEGTWTPQGPQLQVTAQLTQLRASIRSDRELTVSGPVQARMDKAGTAITGKLEFDRARIRIPDETPPRLGEDVLVRNAPGLPATDAERRARPAPTAAGRTVTLTVSLDLGPDFRVSGRGVDTRLAGTLDVQGRSLALPRLVGIVRTVGGTYNAYGQRMNIERGELRFTGPADNPALDVLAIRPNMTERVGVQVTGRAQSPHVELYSDAGLGEAETLSWLVLGRSSAGGGAETALLQRAATALLAGRKGNTKGFAGSLGLDDLSVRPDSSSGAVVRLGKRFADNFYAAYERSLSGAMGTLYIFYDISRRVTLRAEAGERTGLDLIFTFAFDRSLRHPRSGGDPGRPASRPGSPGFPPARE